MQEPAPALLDAEYPIASAGLVFDIEIVPGLVMSFPPLTGDTLRSNPVHNAVNPSTPADLRDRLRERMKQSPKA